MSDLSDRVAYLRGLAEGMQLDEAQPQNKLILKMLEVMDEFAKDHKELHNAVDELNEYMESIDEDLSDMEEDIYGELEDDEDEDDKDDKDDKDDDGKDDDSDDNEDEQTVEYACPYCGEVMVFDVEQFDFDEDYLCPNCHKPLFPEDSEEDDPDDQKK